MKTTLHPQLLAAFAISAVIIVLHTRGFADVQPAGGRDLRFHAPVVVGLAPLAAIVPKRDPFVAGLDETVAAAAPKQPTVESMVGATETQNTQPDAKSDSQAGLHLRAVVLGTRRYALVADGSASRIVTIGSRLAGSTVCNITLRGIVLANGAQFIPEENAK